MDPTNSTPRKVIQSKICLLGDFAVGKTSLVRRFVEGRFDDRYLSTIGVKVTRKVLTRPACELSLLIWDLAGGERFKRYEENYLRGAEGGLIVCDLTRPETLDYLSLYAGQLLVLNPHAVPVFIGNKVDLADKREISTEELENASNVFGGLYRFTSAKTGEGVESAFDLLASQIEARHDISP
jgi:small GTP-binding protein